MIEVSLDRDPIDYVLAGSQVLAAVASAVAAGAALRAARSSRDARRDTDAALAIGIRPEVAMSSTYERHGDDFVRNFSVDALGDHGVTDVTLQVHCWDGHSEIRRIESIAPGQTWTGRFERRWTMGREFDETVRAFELDYSDERRIARYEQHLGVAFFETDGVRREGRNPEPFGQKARMIAPSYLVDVEPVQPGRIRRVIRRLRRGR